MVERVAWVNAARDQYRDIITYLFEHRPEGAIERFDTQLEKRINQIKKQPESGRPSPIEDIRYILIWGRYRFYYRFHGNTIYLLFLWDSKQDPKKNPYK